MILIYLYVRDMEEGWLIDYMLLVFKFMLPVIILNINRWNDSKE